MPVLDRVALLAHIRARAEHPSLLVYAVLTGLAMAIERGDFDTETPSAIRGNSDAAR